MVELGSDGIASVLELDLSDGNTLGLADSVDQPIAERPGWARAQRATGPRRASGYDVAAGLPYLAEQAPRPTHDPAGELHYRLLTLGQRIQTGIVLWRGSVDAPGTATG